MMKNKKILVVIMILSLILLMVTGCVKEDQDTSINEENLQEEVQEEEENQQEENEQEEVQEEEENEEEIEGTFVGWMDSSSFEMEADGETFAVRNDDNINIEEDLDGKTVKVTLRKNTNDQYIVTSIEVVE